MTRITQYFEDLYSIKYKANFKLCLHELADSPSYQYTLQFKLPPIKYAETLISRDVFIQNIHSFEKELINILDPKYEEKIKKIEFYEKLLDTLEISKKETSLVKDNNTHIDLYIRNFK